MLLPCLPVFVNSPKKSVSTRLKIWHSMWINALIKKDKKLHWISEMKCGNILYFSTIQQGQRRVKEKGQREWLKGWQHKTPEQETHRIEQIIQDHSVCASSRGDSVAATFAALSIGAPAVVSIRRIWLWLLVISAVLHMWFIQMWRIECIGNDFPFTLATVCWVPLFFSLTVLFLPNPHLNCQNCFR